MMQIVKKSYFTLLELLIVLFIISFGVILTGVKLKEVYQEQRFLSETQQVLSHLAMAQDLMLIMDTDVLVKFAPDYETKQFHVWLEVEKPLKESWTRLIERKLSLTAIQSIELDEKLVRNLTLQFSLGRMTQGVLTLFEGGNRDKVHRSEKRKYEIELRGYPSPIGAKGTVFDEQKKSERSELLYPIEVYEKLYADPNEEKNPET